MNQRLRLRTAVLLLAGTLLAAVAVALAASQARGLWGLILIGGGVGLLLFLAGATRVVPELLNWGTGLILAALVASVPLASGPVSPLVLVEGACLYGAAELGWLAATPPQAITARSLLLRGIVALGGVAVGYLALFGLTLPYVGGPLVTVSGAAAAVVVFFLLRGRPPRRGAGTPRREPVLDAVQ